MDIKDWPLRDYLERVTSGNATHSAVEPIIVSLWARLAKSLEQQYVRNDK